MEEGVVLFIILIGGFLFLIVLLQRIREYKNDKYKDVEK
tara:strand:- start:319 stop:435 length:117 start_codon:yes stop_codon:yes gene_type:complete